MSSLFLCRLCQLRSTSNNSVPIVGKKFERENWKNRITELLHVVIASDDGLPLHICMKCCRHVEGLEKAVKDLEEFRQLASKSYTELSQSARRKRNKESGGASVTPETAKSRPPAKRPYTIRSRRLDFGEGLSDVTNMQGI